MPVRRDPPPTDEGWFALHDFRTIDWDAWRSTPERERERILAEVTEHLDSRLAVADADEGASAMYSILGHEADLLVLHLRPTSAHIGALERQFEQTAFAEYTERTDSFVSVTEASGYSERAREYFDGELDEDSGLANYMRTRLYPTIPDATHVCFYPMDKRRQPEQNWYDLSFEERAEHMDAHGDIGRDYGGKVVQMITGAIALDDWEWGVTLWGDDLVDMKDLLYEMRFDPSTSQYAEFGPFYIGRRIEASDLPGLLAGEPVPADADHDIETTAAAGAGHEASGSNAAESTETVSESPPESTNTAAVATGYGRGGPDEASHEESSDHGDDGTESSSASESGHPSGGKPPMADTDETWTDIDDIEERTARVGLYHGSDYEGSGFALVLYSDADAQPLADEVADLRESFDHYDTHVMTKVRAQQGQSSIVSVWDSERAADTAHGFLRGLPDITESYGGPFGDGEATDSHDTAEQKSADTDEIRDELDAQDVYAGQPHGKDEYALVLYSQADRETLESEVADLSDGFDRYDTHEWTAVYTDPDSDTNAVVSLWETPDAAETASEYLMELPAIVGRADETDGFGTMGMFYTVKPDHRDEFVEKFDTVGGLLDEMEGHRETALLVNTDDENDMFIASQWDSKEDAMAFFRSDDFADTVDWGRDVLADTPRHVFLA